MNDPEQVFLDLFAEAKALDPEKVAAFFDSDQFPQATDAAGKPAGLMGDFSRRLYALAEFQYEAAMDQVRYGELELYSMDETTALMLRSQEIRNLALFCIEAEYDLWNDSWEIYRGGILYITDLNEKDPEQTARILPMRRIPSTILE